MRALVVGLAWEVPRRNAAVAAKLPSECQGVFFIFHGFCFFVAGY